MTQQTETGTTKPFYYRYWCEDCVTVGDKEGCFGGVTESDDERFESPELAYLAGLHGTRHCGLWEFEVVHEETGEVITLDEKTASDLFLAYCRPSPSL